MYIGYKSFHHLQAHDRKEMGLNPGNTILERRYETWQSESYIGSTAFGTDWADGGLSEIDWAISETSHGINEAGSCLTEGELRFFPGCIS